MIYLIASCLITSGCGDWNDVTPASPTGAGSSGDTVATAKSDQSVPVAQPVVVAQASQTTAPAPAAGAGTGTSSSSSGSQNTTTTNTTNTTTTATTTTTPITTTTTPTPTTTTPTTTTNVTSTASTSGLDLSVAGMRADMTGAHESTIAGVPAAWSWGSQADFGFGLTGFPSSWTSPAYTMWGIVGPADSGSPATNVRVQIRRVRADFKRNGAWYRAQYQKGGLGGANYTNYTTNQNSPADIVQMGDDGIAVKLTQTSGFHFYPTFRVPFSRDLQGLVVSMDVRLIKDNPNGVDDIDSARIYGVSAGDVYQSMTAQWNGTTWVNGHAPIGRFRQIGREWRTITAHLGLSSDAQFQEYINWAKQQPL
ncbi:MAG: hypothetical protein R3E83_10925 [Burkholderiaceae bacterium]